MEYLRRNAIWLKLPFTLYITRLNYQTFMFYQRVMVVALENSALEFDSIYSYGIKNRFSAIYIPTPFIFNPQEVFQKLDVFPSALELEFCISHIYFHTLDAIKN